MQWPDPCTACPGHTYANRLHTKVPSTNSLTSRALGEFAQVSPANLHAATAISPPTHTCAPLHHAQQSKPRDRNEQTPARTGTLRDDVMWSRASSPVSAERAMAHASHAIVAPFTTTIAIATPARKASLTAKGTV